MVNLKNSHLRFMCIGHVAVDKNDASKFISVFPTELFPFHEGDITSDHVDVERKGKDADGNEYSVTLQKGMTLKAEWYGEDNRITAPCVRKGEQVEIYQLGGTERYYWKSMGRDASLRRTEAVTYAWNASGKEVTEDIPITGDNSYTSTIDTKNGHATFTTSMDNGEVAAYTFQFNGKEGHATITDHLGNVVQVDTTNNSITAKNAAGSYILITGPNANIYAPGEIKLNSLKISVEGDLLVTGKTNLQSDVTCNNSLTAAKLITPDLQAANNPT